MVWLIGRSDGWVDTVGWVNRREDGKVGAWVGGMEKLFVAMNLVCTVCIPYVLIRFLCFC